MELGRQNDKSHAEKESVSVEFKYGVFLSHSAMDKLVVRPLAERLRKDGLEHSRALVFCISANAS